MANIGSIAEQVFGPDDMEWEETKYSFLTGLLKREGGDTLVTDTGGLTKYGISTRAHGKQGYDIKNLTEDEARTIYEEQYIPDAINRIGRNSVAFKFIDMNVNMGWGNATSVLQKALGLPSDGAFGPETQKRLQQMIETFGEEEVINKLSKAQKSYYDSLRASNPSKYGKYRGWDERAAYNPVKE